MKSALIQSKCVKKPILLKQVVNDLSKLRDSIQFDETYLQKFNSAIIEASLYERVNKIEGLNIIMEKVFEEIVKDEVLSPFYKDKNIQVLQKRYAYYIAGQIGGKFDWLGQDVIDCHESVSSKFQQITTKHLYQMQNIFK